MDLIDIGQYDSDNGGIYWILRKDTSNMTKAVTPLLKQCTDQFGDYPKLAQFDEGKEFFNLRVKAVLDKHLQNLIRRRQW